MWTSQKVLCSDKTRTGASKVYSVPVVEHGGGSIMVWDYFFDTCTDALQKVMERFFTSPQINSLMVETWTQSDVPTEQ